MNLFHLPFLLIICRSKLVKVFLFYLYGLSLIVSLTRVIQTLIVPSKYWFGSFDGKCGNDATVNNSPPPPKNFLTNFTISSFEPFMGLDNRLPAMVSVHPFLWQFFHPNFQPIVGSIMYSLQSYFYDAFCS